MAITNVVTPNNLGQTIKAAHLAAGKYDVNIDGVSITSDANGVLSAKSGDNITNTLVVGHKIADIVDGVTGTTTSLNETVTKIVDAINTVTYTDENGADTVSTKIGTVVNTVDAVAKTLITTVNGVASTATDISAFYADINVGSTDYNASTYVLTLTETDGTIHILNLASLVAIATANSTSVTLTGNGEIATPLTAEVKVDVLAGNLLKVTAAGVKVDPADILALATVDVVDAFGVHLFNAFE